MADDTLSDTATAPVVSALHKIRVFTSESAQCGVENFDIFKSLQLQSIFRLRCPLSDIMVFKQVNEHARDVVTALLSPSHAPSRLPPPPFPGVISHSSLPLLILWGPFIAERRRAWHRPP